jgi:hypothetical protein
MSIAFLPTEAWRLRGGASVRSCIEVSKVGYRTHHAVGNSADLGHAIPAALEAVREAWISERMTEDREALERAGRIVSRSLATTRLEPHDLLGVEHYFRSETPDGWHVAGAADLVVRTGPRGLEVRDHKVTHNHSTPAQLVHDFQLNPYGWLAQLPRDGRTVAGRINGLPEDHRLVHPPPVEVRPDRPLELIDERMHLFVRLRPLEVA